MSINRAPFTGAVTGHHMQGKFCYYRKGAAVSGVTDVLVVCDGATMGLMSPTEHFSLNSGFKYIEFKPVDPLCVGEFVLADTAEEYGSSAVAGSVSISGGLVGADSDAAQETYSTSSQSFLYGYFGGSVTALDLYLINPLASGKKMYMKRRTYTSTASPTSYGIQFGFSWYTAGNFTNSANNGIVQKNLPYSLDAHGASIAQVSTDTTGITWGSVTRMLTAQWGTAGDMKFDHPLILSPGQFLHVGANFASPSGFTTMFEWYEK